MTKTEIPAGFHESADRSIRCELRAPVRLTCPDGSPVPRCQAYRAGQARCTSLADGTLCDPDGVMTPGGYYCSEHASRTVAEYAEKLGEQWVFRPFF